MVETRSVVGKVSKKELSLILLLRMLKGEYKVNFSKRIRLALSEAGFADDQIDDRLFSTRYIKQPHEHGIRHVAVGFSRFGHGSVTRKVVGEFAEMNRYCGTLHVGLAIARKHPVIETDIKILMLGTSMQFPDVRSSGWSPLIELGPNTRRLTMVYRSPPEGWGKNTQHLGFQIMNS